MSCSLDDTSFRVRPTKTPLSDPHQTVDTKHQEKVNEFVTNKKNLEKFKKKLKDYKKEYHSLIDKRLVNLSKKEFERYKELHDEIKKMETKIYDIETDTSEIDYYANSYKLIYEYYTNESLKPNEEESDSESESEEIDSKQGLESVLSIKTTTNKSRILDDYLSATDKSYQSKKIEVNKKVGKCTECDSENLVFNHIDCIYVCHDCGIINEYDSRDDYTPSYKEMQDIDYQPQYAYKKLNHFIDHLNNLQAEEVVNIPDKVITAIKKEMKKERLPNEKLDPKRVRIYLKKHRLSKYYIYAQRIISLVTGIKTKPIMDNILKEKLINMFKEVLEPWYKTCPDERYNFFSYKYIIYKFCELLGEDHILKYCNLLKDRENLYKQDVMWKNVCKVLRWEFIPSV